MVCILEVYLKILLKQIPDNREREREREREKRNKNYERKDFSLSNAIILF